MLDSPQAVNSVTVFVGLDYLSGMHNVLILFVRSMGPS